MADNIAKMRAALNDGASVTVQGISPEQLSAMQTATNYANANYPQTEKQTSLLQNVPSLNDISNFVQNFPVEAQRLLTNPQAFTQAITGKNPLPEETGFAASFTGLPEKNPNSLFTPEGMAYSKGYETGEPYGIAAQFTPAVGTFAKPTAKMLAEMANKQIMETGGIKLPGMPEIPVVNYAVKPSGGNWSRLDMAVNPLRLSAGDTPMSQSLNNWIESKLKKYIRNDLATPNDPVRELADQGISHISNLEDRYTGLDNRLENFRLSQGFNPKGYSKTNMGHVWENLADKNVYPKNIKDYIGDKPATANRNPWMTDLYMKDPTAKINELDMSGTIDLGFDHLVDELHNAINKYSDIPQHLRLKPETLDRITVPQAVQHVAKINSWRAEQMAKASKESLNDFPIVYKSNDGFNIHELKLPEEPPTNWRQDDAGRWISPEGKISNIDPRYEMLDKALKNEGTQMGHCVGGYTKDVADGESRIFTLRDPKGGAHVTIETIPSRQAFDKTPGMQDITQIKGKANGLVSEKYQNYIQDFLNKNSNQFGNVNDLKNVGLADLNSFVKSPNWSNYASYAFLPGELKSLGFDIPESLAIKLKEVFPNKRFVSLEEIRAALNLPPVK